jgi:glycosyltransferase involved in cell wall biosynthesis
MRVALIAEGCYPFVTGGVSTWCDQLVRGLDDHWFEVIAVTATSRVRPVIALPDNVVGVRMIPLWDWKALGRRVSGGARRRFEGLYRTLLGAMLDVHALQRGFDLALMELFEFAQGRDLSALFRTDDPVRTLLDVWPTAFPHVPLPVRDALEATELMEHLLLPLAAAVPRADVTHPVSNGLPAMVALAAKWRHGTPILMSEHGVYLRERYLAFHSVEYRWPVKAVMLAFVRRLCRTAYQEADIVVPVNVFNRRWEIRHGAEPDRVRTVYNGVDADSLPAAEADPQRPTVGWIGRIDPLKDLHTLVKAFGVAAERVPDAVLRLFGPTPAGNEEYEASVRRLVTELGLDDRVSFEGPVRPATTAYHASTVVALSSISEGLPYTVMEAMMCARATVSTDVGGVAEVAGDTGLVVPPGDPQRFGEALVELLTDDARRADLASRARHRALEMFRLETMLATFRQLYAELQARAGAGRSAEGSRLDAFAQLPRVRAPYVPHAVDPLTVDPLGGVDPLGSDQVGEVTG